MSWQICALADDPAAAFVKTRPVNKDVGSSTSFAFARECLEECHSSHTVPCAAAHCTTPSRLIDIGIDGLAPRIIDTKDLTFKYCALSYCWGGDQPYKLTRSNINDYQSQLNIPSDAKTIHDALLTTRSLGLRYVWIDALCIVQDDEDDMNRELVRMPSIYKNAYVTVIVGSAKTHAHGFLERRRQNFKSPCFRLPCRCPGGAVGSVYLYKEPYGHARVGPLESPCMGTSGVDFVPPVIDLWRGLGAHTLIRKAWPPKDVQEAMVEWRSIIEQYTRRSLTNSSDRLAAIAGIANELMDGLQAGSLQYSAGIWHVDIRKQLFWRAERPSLKPTNLSAPSWSWASIDSPITFPTGTPLIKIHCDLITLKNPHMVYGEISQGLLAVEGWLKQGYLVQETSEMEIWDPKMPNDMEVATAELDLEEDKVHDVLKTPVWCLEAARPSFHYMSEGLILLPARRSDLFVEPYSPIEAIATRPRSPLLGLDPGNKASREHPERPRLQFFRRIGFSNTSIHWSDEKEDDHRQVLNKAFDPSIRRWGWFEGCERQTIVLV